MDPLSITASTISIIQVTSELIIGCRSYYKSVKNSPEEIAEILQELESFDVLLRSLKDISQSADKTPQQQVEQWARHDIPQQKTNCLPMLQKMLEAGGPLSLCYHEMVVFKRKLTKDQSRFKKSLKWPFQKDEIKVVISRLRNLKSLLDTAIARDQLYVHFWSPGHQQGQLILWIKSKLI